MGTRDSYVICFCRSSFEHVADTVVSSIRNETGCETLMFDDFIGHGYLSVHWTEFSKIEAVLTALLQKGHSFQLVNCMNLPYSPEKGDSMFRWSTLEEKVIQRLKKLLADPLFADARNELLFREQFTDPWIWKTDEGKALCKRLRHLKHLPVEADEKENFWKWPCFKDVSKDWECRPLTAAESTVPACQPLTSPVAVTPPPDGAASDKTLPEPEKDAFPAAWTEEPITCIICMDAKADTMVLPCMHQVVCRACSRALQDTDNATRCVICRQDIKEVVIA